MAKTSVAAVAAFARKAANKAIIKAARAPVAKKAVVPSKKKVETARASKKQLQEDSLEDALEEADEDEDDDAEKYAEEDAEAEGEVVQKPVSKKRAADAESAAESPAKKSKSEEAAAVPADPTTIFFSVLPWSADEASVAADFADCGKVTSVRLPIDRLSRTKEGFGYVTFATEDAARAAIKLGTKTIGGRPVRIVESRPPKLDEPPKENPTNILLVRNLPPSASDDALAKLFGRFTVVSTRIPADRTTGRPKSVAYVTLGSVDEAKAAVTALNGADFGGRIIRVGYFIPEDSSNGGRGGARGGARGGRGGSRGGRGAYGGLGARGRGGRGGRGSGGRGRGRGGQ
ncbi:hypothetical protein DFJ73DRAFT_872882 [Zopfochytrium polystomum]|nr:hypothetical protein DFJ73DRAFT_872882 [Zopfochytrium polystomum]